MFEKTRRRFFLAAFLPTLLGVLLSLSSILGAVFYLNERDFLMSAQESLERLASDFRFSVSLVRSSVSSLERNSDILGYLSGNLNFLSGAQNALSQKQGSARHLMGVALYPAKEGLSPISSYSLSGIASQEEMLSLPEVSSLAPGESALFIRTEAGHASYYFSSYREEDGILTLAERMDRGDAYLVSDFKTESVYEDFLSLSGLSDMGECELYLHDGDRLLQFLGGKERIEEEGLGAELSSRDGALALSMPLMDGVDMVSRVGKGPLVGENLWMLAAYVPIALLFLLFGFLLARALSRRISVPLGELSRRMAGFGE